MGNVTTSAEENLSKNANFARVREREFVELFQGDIRKLVEALGVTRKIQKESGSVLKVMKVTGTLENGAVPEGEIIPLSQYATSWEPIGEITLKKWRKSTTIEAINDKGYNQAVLATTDKMRKQIQRAIRTDFFTFLATGTRTATGDGFQDTLANAWGQLQVIFEDTDSQPVFFMNPLDLAGYLGSTSANLAQLFGFTYLKNFLGLGDCFLNSDVPKGKIYATVKDNIVLYYVNAAAADISEGFQFTTDETGLVGIHEYPDYDRDTVNDSVVSGIKLFAENLYGVVVGTIGDTPSA